MNAACADRSNLLADVVVTFLKRRRRRKLDIAVARHAQALAQLAEARHVTQTHWRIGGFWADELIKYAGDVAYWAKRVEQLRQES